MPRHRHPTSRTDLAIDLGPIGELLAAAGRTPGLDPLPLDGAHADARQRGTRGGGRHPPRARHPRALHPGRGRGARRGSVPGRARPARRVRPEPAAVGLRPRDARDARPRGARLRARRRERHRGHARRPASRAHGAAVRGPRGGRRRDEGGRARLRGADGRPRRRVVAAAARRGARGSAARLPAAPPVGRPARPVAQVGRARDVRAGDDLRGVRRPPQAVPRRGGRAPVPHRRLPRPAVDRADVGPHRGARRPRRVARRGRAPHRLQPARRVGGAGQPHRRAR